jgi:hypothetical protein
VNVGFAASARAWRDGLCSPVVELLAGVAVGTTALEQRVLASDVIV